MIILLVLRQTVEQWLRKIRLSVIWLEYKHDIIVRDQFRFKKYQAERDNYPI